MQDSRKQQRGAALIIGLILLMVLTVLAISTMRTASLELLMAGNAQYRENAFQLAESGLDGKMRQVTAGTPLPSTTTACPDAVVDPAARVDALGGSYTTRTCFRGYTDSLDSGDSLGKIGAYHFEITSDAQTDQRDARARLAQGFYVRGPALP